MSQAKKGPRSLIYHLSGIDFVGTSVISGNGVALVLRALYSISVAVGLVPEMPPTITGTLTKDEITLRRYVEYTGKTNTDALKLVTVDSVVQGSNGNNIDGATIEHRMADGRSINTAQYEKVAAIPLNFERHRSACIVKRATRTNLLIVKGAFEEVLRLCSTVRQGGVAVPLDFQKKEMLVTRTNRLNREGFRALLVAEKDIGEVDLRD
ncbi:hypothetical protein E4U09_002042 [Claviceps aff. purpurea]|uniref:Uncharacterized protein n=1 Tax=Claviceps aff. purpurea TaxID=1967640 RepID=A0A9P7QLA4_9HYPO|nr:hypothetical protein E4U09_002042 [Claviceps aff. purpurea]